MIFFCHAESDLIPGIGTFVACLVLRLEVGILVGIGINILFILYHAARPKIAIENQVVSVTFSATC
jgi:sodium-independent sulfate anion transporter 11